ncbi:MAG: SAM-dependent chlorinase/fluorinase [Bacteroidales bacterium]|nr:SAM-dependent chlorinase/fluorinase [Bacteroidales bacterium]
MVLITLTTDWNRQDYYAGMMKGRILSLLPDASIQEVTHHIEPFHSLEGAFVLRQIIGEYPEKSIHLFLVNQGNRPDVYPLIISTKGKSIIAWEDSVLGLVIDDEPDYCLRVTPDVFVKIKKELRINNSGVSPSFPELGLFPVLSLFIQGGFKYEDFGQNETERITSSPWLPVIQEQSISGRVLYIDSYGNAISNITKGLFEKIRHERKYEIYLISNHYRIDKINTAYLETEPGEILALFNALNFLEVAMVHASVSEMLGLETGSTIKVNFND